MPAPGLSHGFSCRNADLQQSQARTHTKGTGDAPVALLLLSQRPLPGIPFSWGGSTL